MSGPSRPLGEVYVTQALAALLTLHERDDEVCEYAGIIQSAKARAVAEQVDVLTETPGHSGHALLNFTLPPCAKNEHEPTARRPTELG
jgi:hypothetical protein